MNRQCCSLNQTFPKGQPNSNLFLHSALGYWLITRRKRIQFCRYADDWIVHCRTRKQAIYLHQQIADRLKECGLEIHPEKIRIVFFKDANRTDNDENIQLDFLGFTFRPRKAMNKSGCAFMSFLPAPSNLALKAMKQTIRRRHLPLKCSCSLSDLARRFSSVIRGWMSYFCHFRPSAFQSISFHLDRALGRWDMRKYKRLRAHVVRAGKWIRERSQRQPGLFPHWRRSSTYVAGSMGAQ